MNIKVVGLHGGASIKLDSDRRISGNDSYKRDAALIGETLFWHLPSEVFNLVFKYMGHKLQELQINKAVGEVLSSTGKPAFHIVHPDGEHHVTTEKEILEAFKHGTDGAEDSDPSILDEDFNEEDSD